MSNNIQNQNLINTLIKGIQYIVDQTLKNNMTKSYDGLVLSENTDGTWNIQFNGKTHAIKPYKITPTPNTMVKVIVPQGNLNIAYFI